MTDCIFSETWIHTWQQPSLTHEYVHDNLLTHNTTTFNDTAAETPHSNTNSNHQHGFLHNFVVKGLQLQLQSQCGHSDHFVSTQLPVPHHGYVLGDSRRTLTPCGREHCHNRQQNTLWGRKHCHGDSRRTPTLCGREHCHNRDSKRTLWQRTGTAGEHCQSQKRAVSLAHQMFYWARAIIRMMILLLKGLHREDGNKQKR